MKYSIEWSERKTTSTGKPVVSATLKDESGASYDKVSIWSDFPNYANLMTGHIVEGEIIISDKGYKSLKPVFQAKPSGNAGYKQKMAEDLMGKKNESISQFQASKEASIKTSSTFTAAWNLAIAEYQEIKRTSPHTAVTLESLFDKWREFGWSKFEVGDTQYPPF